MFVDISDIFTIIGAVATIIGVFVAILIPIIKVYVNNAIIGLEKGLSDRIDEKFDAKFGEIDTKFEEFEIRIKEGVTEVVTQILVDAGVASDD